MTDSLKSALVLVVDDDMMMRLLARETLEQAGFRVEEAEDGEAAVSAFQALRPDVVMLDVLMPVLDGFDTCAALRRLDGGMHVPILMMTGLDDTDSINRVYEVGATDFITKPIAWPMLGHRVNYVLRANRAFVDLTQSQARLTNAQRIAQLGHWEWDIRTDHVQRSDEVCRILGLTPQQMAPAHAAFTSLIHPQDRRIVEDAVYAALHRQQPFSIDFRIVQPDGATRIVHEQAEVVYDAAGNATRMQGTTQDITERKRAEEQIQQLALYDSLTGLPNRHLFKEQLTRAVARAERTGELVVMLSLDLDRFKRINDTLGHEVGDLLLKETAARLNCSVRQTDYVTRRDSDARNHCIARQGGDEFSVLLTDLSQAQGAAKVAQRILDVISEPFRFGDNEIVIGASIGIAVYPLDGADCDTLLKNADAAKSYAKEHGKNTYEYYDQNMNASAVQKLTLESSLRRALERNEFSLFYQPKIDVNSRSIVGVEALIRWHHPERGLVSPAEFIPVAEETGLIIPIGEWVLRTACAQIRAWLDAGITPVPIAINLSATQFHQQNICELVTAALRDYRVAADMLEIEITESAAMQNAQATSATLHRLKAIGVSIAIDDFGTGYSSLSYLKRFPIDSLKIDRSFVTELPGNQDDASIAQAVITMGHALRLKIVAEGVETEAQLDFLAANFCDEMQGYYFARPQPADACTQLMLKNACATPAEHLGSAIVA
jgi:diguanylate cyclase (GGDEF)-like protein/PAS domain S-box-containing protein